MVLVVVMVMVVVFLGDGATAAGRMVIFVLDGVHRVVHRFRFDSSDVAVVEIGRYVRDGELVVEVRLVVRRGLVVVRGDDVVMVVVRGHGLGALIIGGGGGRRRSGRCVRFVGETVLQFTLYHVVVVEPVVGA